MLGGHACNAPAERLLGGFGGNALHSRNVLARLFLDKAWRQLFVDWDAIARSACTQFRAVSAGQYSDVDFQAFSSALESKAQILRRYGESTVWKIRHRGPRRWIIPKPASSPSITSAFSQVGIAALR
jgi:hypothetical protein